MIHDVCLCPSVSLSVCLSACLPACKYAASMRINENQLFCRVLLHMAVFFASSPMESYGCMFVYEPMIFEAPDVNMQCTAESKGTEWNVTFNRVLLCATQLAAKCPSMT